MIEDLAALMVQPGQRIRAEDNNGLARAIQRRTLRSGRGVRLQRLDTHTLISFDGPAVTSVQHAWKPRVEVLDVGIGVRFARGLVNGMEPRIGEELISAEDVEPLRVPGYNAAGDALVYVELKLDAQSWRITAATMAAYAERPGAVPFVARKLICIVQNDGRVWPRAFFDLGFASSQRKPNGTFKTWWWPL